MFAGNLAISMLDYNRNEPNRKIKKMIDTTGHVYELNATRRVPKKQKYNRKKGKGVRESAAILKGNGDGFQGRVFTDIGECFKIVRSL